MKDHSSLPQPSIGYRAMQAVMWPILKMSGMSCQASYELCSKQLDQKLGLGEAMRLRGHLMICSVCRNLPAQFRGLNELVRACDHQNEELAGEHLSAEGRSRIEEHLRSEPERSP